MYFYVNKMQNMLLDDWQYPQHLPHLSTALCLHISQVDIQGVKQFPKLEYAVII